MLHASTLQVSDEIVTASKRFRQGSVLRDVPFAYGARFDKGVTSATRDLGNDASTGAVRVDMQYAIVTTQTCDLRQPKRIAIRPFITVARVFDAATEFDKSTLGHIRAKRYNDVLPLSAPDFQRDGELWVADLRWEATLERSVLVDREPLEGFADEQGYLDFGRRVAGVRGRVAIADNVISYVLTPLENEFKTNRLDPDSVKEVRVLCTPTTVDAQAVEVHVLIVDDADEAGIRTHIDGWYAEVVSSLDGSLTFSDVQVHFASEYTDAEREGTEHVNFDDMTASRY